MQQLSPLLQQWQKLPRLHTRRRLKDWLDTILVIGRSSIWRSFATRLQIEKQKRQKLLVNLHDIDIREDVIRGGIPRLLVEVDYTHPILSEIPNGTFGCGAPADRR